MKLKEMQSLYDNLSEFLDYISVNGVFYNKKEAELMWLIRDRAQELVEVIDDEQKNNVNGDYESSESFEEEE